MALRVFGLNIIKNNRNLLQNAGKINGVSNTQAVSEKSAMKFDSKLVKVVNKMFA